MRRFQFQLETLLRLRRQQHRLAENALAVAVADRARGAAEVEAARGEWEEQGRRLAAERGRGLDRGYVVLEAARRAVDAAVRRLAELDRVVAERTTVERAAAVARESLETLRGRRLEEYRDEVEAATQLERDDRVLREWMRSGE